MSHSTLVVLIFIGLLIFSICIYSCRKINNDCKNLRQLYQSNHLTIEQYIIELQCIVAELNGLGATFNKISLDKSIKKKKMKRKNDYKKVEA